MALKSCKETEEIEVKPEYCKFPVISPGQFASPIQTKSNNMELAVTASRQIITGIFSLEVDGLISQETYNQDFMVFK